MTDSATEEQAKKMIMGVFESLEDGEWITEKKIHHQLNRKINHVLLDHYLAILCEEPSAENGGKPLLKKIGGSSKPGANKYTRNV